MMRKFIVLVMFTAISLWGWPSISHAKVTISFGSPKPVKRVEREKEKEPRVILHGDDSGKIYKESECIGASVMGVCHGSVIDTQPGRKRCHGTWLAGECIGAEI